MSKMSKACAIPRKVKEAVWERDGGCCILCGNPHASPNAHIVPRSRGGMGIEQNIVTLCPDCHRAFDQGTDRRKLYQQVSQYMAEIYPGWNPQNLIYRKWENAK